MTQAAKRRKSLKREREDYARLEKGISRFIKRPVIQEIRQRGDWRRGHIELDKKVQVSGHETLPSHAKGKGRMDD